MQGRKFETICASDPPPPCFPHCLWAAFLHAGRILLPSGASSGGQIFSPCLLKSFALPCKMWGPRESPPFADTGPDIKLCLDWWRFVSESIFSRPLNHSCVLQRHPFCARNSKDWICDLRLERDIFQKCWHRGELKPGNGGGGVLGRKTQMFLETVETYAVRTSLSKWNVFFFMNLKMHFS